MKMEFCVQNDKQTSVIQDEVRRYQEALIDYKEKLNKTVTGIHQDIIVSLNGMKIKVDAISGVDSHFTAHVKHLGDELKKIDLNYETIQRFIKKVNKVKAFTAISATQIKEFESLIKNYEKKITINSQVSTLLQNYMQSTGKYLGLFLPFQIMNQISEAMHASIEGKPYNKLIFYEQSKYQELESLITQNDLSKFSKDTYKIPIIPDFVEELQNQGQQVFRQSELQMQTMKSGGNDINSNNFNSGIDQNSEESHANKDDTLSDHMSQNTFQNRYPKSQIQDYKEQSIADRKGSANRSNRRVSYYNDKYGVKLDNYTEVPANKMPNDTISEGEKTQSNFSLYNQKFRLDQQPKNNTAAKVGQFLNQNLSDAPSTRMRISRKPKMYKQSLLFPSKPNSKKKLLVKVRLELEETWTNSRFNKQIMIFLNLLFGISKQVVLRSKTKMTNYRQVIYQQEKETTPTNNLLLHKNESLISSGTQTAKAIQNIQDFSNRASIQVSSQMIPRKLILQLSNDQESKQKKAETMLQLSIDQQQIQEEQYSNLSNSGSPQRGRKSVQRIIEESQQVHLTSSSHNDSNKNSSQAQAYGNNRSIIQTRNSVVTNQTFDFQSQRNIDSTSAQPSAQQINSNIYSHRVAPDLGKIISDEDFITRLKDLFINIKKYLLKINAINLSNSFSL